jgi:hypothetical protein
MEDIRGPYMSQELDTVITEAIFQLLFTKSTEEDQEIVKLLELLGFKIGMKMYWREREIQIIN